MGIFGHHEEVRIQGSREKATVYVPSPLRSALPPIAAFAMLIAILLYPNDGEQSPLSYLLAAFLLVFGLLGIWYGAKEQKEARRMRGGELVCRSGKLFIISRASSGKYGCRFALRNTQGNVEIYDMPEKIYEGFCAYGGDRVDPNDQTFTRLRAKVCQVEVIVLPPEKGEAFRLIDLSARLKKHAVLPEGEYPLYMGTVTNIFYKKKLSEACYVGSGVLFE